MSDIPDSEKDLGGRPLKYKTVKELQDRINEYFDYCDNKIKDVYVRGAGDTISVSQPAPYTMAGLAYYLGLSRQALLEYRGRGKYGDAIKAARRKIEWSVEEGMLSSNGVVAGHIFNAKNNFGWKDKTEVDQNTNGKVTVEIVNYSNTNEDTATA